MLQDLCTVEEAAAGLKLHVKTVRQYVRDGRLKATRVGRQYRLSRHDLEAFAGGSVALSARQTVQPSRRVDVFCIVAIEAIDRAEVIRLTNALLAAARSNSNQNGPPLRVETVYDEACASLKVVLIGSATATAYMLGLIELYGQTRKERPGPKGGCAESSPPRQAGRPSSVD